MPISYEIDSVRRLVLATATGVLTDEDVLQHKQRLAKDPDFEPGMRELSDVRAIERLAVTPEGVRSMAGHDETHAATMSRHRLAIVVSADVAFGMGRMYQGLTEPIAPNVRVFRDMTEALTWLEADHPRPR